MRARPTSTCFPSASCSAWSRSSWPSSPPPGRGGPAAAHRRTAAIVLATLLFPAMGGLAARGRNGWARLLLILAFVYVFAIDSTPTMIALFAGFAALSFAVSDLQRTARDLSWVAAGLVIAGAAHRARRGAAGAAGDARQAAGLCRRPIPSLALALRSGHSGLAAADHRPRLRDAGARRADRHAAAADAAPALFEIWYELGMVGALIASARRLVRLPRHRRSAAAARALSRRRARLQSDARQPQAISSDHDLVHCARNCGDRRRRRRAQPVSHDAALGGDAGAFLSGRRPPSFDGRRTRAVGGRRALRSDANVYGLAAAFAGTTVPARSIPSRSVTRRAP